VVFSSEGHRLAGIHVATDAAGGTTPFSVPLEGVAPVNGQLRVDVEASLPLIDAYCQGQFLIPEVDLDGMAVTYGGRAMSPATIASFLPPFLSTLRVWVPGAPTEAAAEGAIGVADQVVSRYGAAPVRIDVRPLGVDLPDPGPFDSLSRDIVFSGPSATPGAQLVSSPSGAPLLVVSGDGDPLRHQVDVVVSELVKLVANDHLTAGGQFIPRRIPAAEQTFTDLGIGSLAVHGQGSLRFTVKFSQADFGHMIDWVRLHVSGTYTPIPAGAARQSQRLLQWSARGVETRRPPRFVPRCTRDPGESPEPGQHGRSPVSVRPRRWSVLALLGPGRRATLGYQQRRDQSGHFVADWLPAPPAGPAARHRLRRRRAVA